MRRNRRRLARILLVAFGLLVALAVAEIALRVVPARRGRAHVARDPVLHHRFVPGARVRVAGQAYAINRLGLRDREIAVPKPPGLVRVLMLGDSFTEGWGLAFEDTVPKRVERLLAHAGCATPVEVVNAGVGSYSPILEYLLLERLAPTIEPDVVVLDFDMTDVHDDWIRTRLATLDDNGLPRAVPADERRETALLLPPLARATAHGPLAAWQRRLDALVLYQRLRRSSLGRRVFGPLDLSPERLRALGLVGDIRFDVEAITRDVETPSVAAAWRLTERYLAGIHSLARRRGARFALVVYPHAQQVAADESPFGRRRHGIDAGLHGSRRPLEILAALGRREGFPVIDLLPLFRARHGRDGPLFRNDDIHHTPHGARVFAEGVVSGLIEHRLVPCSPAR